MDISLPPYYYWKFRLIHFSILSLIFIIFRSLDFLSAPKESRPRQNRYGRSKKIFSRNWPPIVLLGRDHRPLQKNRFTENTKRKKQGKKRKFVKSYKYELENIAIMRKNIKYLKNTNYYVDKYELLCYNEYRKQQKGTIIYYE